MNAYYTDLLVDEYVRRKTANSRYSERAFARALGLSPGFLKLLFQRKKDLSVARAQEIAARLGWSELKKQAFCKAVQGRKAFRRSEREPVDLQDFLEISDWFHFAILELVKARRQSLSSAEIARALRLSKTEVTFALKLLVDKKLVRVGKDGKYEGVRHYEVPSASSAAIRKYHRQTLALAIEAVENQEYDQRDIRAVALAFDPKRMKEAEEFFDQFVKEFDRRFSAGDCTSVYHLNLAFFRMDTGE